MPPVGGNPAGEGPGTEVPSPAGHIHCAICTHHIGLHQYRTARCWTDPHGTTVAAHHHCPIDIGWWTMRDGTRRLLTWWSDGGELVLGHKDVLAIVTDEDDLRRRLAGWENHCDLRDGLGWIAGQLDGCR